MSENIWIIVAAAATFHTALLALVLYYLLNVHRRFGDLRDARSEAQAWLAEFGRVVSVGATTVHELKKSVAVAQEDLQQLIAKADILSDNGSGTLATLRRPAESAAEVKSGQKTSAAVRPMVDFRIDDAPVTAATRRPRGPEARETVAPREPGPQDHPLAGLR